MAELNSITWCASCVHFIRKYDYENSILESNWQSDKMISEDLLPCKIIDKTKSTWDLYFKSDPMQRKLFPNNCEYYVQSEKPNKLRPKPTLTILGFIIVCAIIAIFILFFTGWIFIEDKFFYRGFFEDIRLTIMILFIVVTSIVGFISHRRK